MEKIYIQKIKDEWRNEIKIIMIVLSEAKINC